MKATLLVIVFFISLVKSKKLWPQEGHKHSLRYRDVKAASSFGYEGSKGPAHWGSLSDEWKKCASGDSQSPISLTGAQNVRDNENNLELHWSNLNGPNIFINNGHTWEIDAEGRGNWLSYKNTEYDLLQWHFHAPSEHHVRGKNYAMEGHFVHQNEESGDLLVVGVFFETEAESETNEWLSQFWEYFSDEEGEEEHDVDIDFNDFVNELDIDDYWTYSGSLTTPPCTEGVTFVILKETQKLTPEEVTALNTAVRYNSRYTQDVNGRVAL